MNVYGVRRTDGGYKVVPLLNVRQVRLKYAREAEFRVTVDGKDQVMSRWGEARPWFETEAEAEAWIAEKARYEIVEQGVLRKLAELKAEYEAKVAEAIKPRSAATKRLTDLQKWVRVPRFKSNQPYGYSRGNAWKRNGNVEVLTEELDEE